MIPVQIPAPARYTGAMIDPEDAVAVMEAAPSELQRFVDRLAEHGIEAEIVRPAQGCGST